MANLRNESGYIAEVAADYLQSLHRGQATAAKDRIRRIVRTPVDLERVYLEVFTPVQHEIGRLWERGDISAATEHLMTAITMELMNELSYIAFSVGSRSPRALITAAPGDLHELGARVVADLLELRGWDATHFSSPEAPAEIIEALDKAPYDLLVVSATLQTSVRRTRSLIRLVKAREGAPICLVGGRAFETQPLLASSVGADGPIVDVTLLSAQAMQLLSARGGYYAPD